MSLITRVSKGSSLSYAEMDGNLEYLEERINQLGTGGGSGTGGVAGTSGSSGTSGASGTSGSSGTSGTRGTSGTSGTSGVGTSGTSGTSGVGTSGTSGTGGTGTSGTSGTSGAAGSSGTSGTSVDFSEYTGDLNITGDITLSGTFNGIDITKGPGSLEGNYGIGATLSEIVVSTSGDASRYNVAIGESSLSSNTTGNYNTATNRSLVFNTTGVWNTAYGYNTMFFNYTGSRNVAIGMWALAGIDASDNNVALGTEAGRFSLAGQMSLSTRSIYIGSTTKAKANNQTNQIVIGNEAIGNGSNTATIGNLSTEALYLGGRSGEGIVLTSPDGTKYKITVSNEGVLNAASVE